MLVYSCYSCHFVHAMHLAAWAYSGMSIDRIPMPLKGSAPVPNAHLDQVEFLQLVPTLQDLTLRGNPVHDEDDFRDKAVSMLTQLQTLDDELVHNHSACERHEHAIDVGSVAGHIDQVKAISCA